jgi:hypothetical protein
VTVTDAFLQQAPKSKVVSVSSSAPICQV